MPLNIAIPRPKAEEFTKLAGISKIYDNLEEVFEDPQVDLVDALLPVQYNLDAVNLAVKHRKDICLEKPIAANLGQAGQIREDLDILISINGNFVYFKAIDTLETAIGKIGKVYSFTYRCIEPFPFSSEYHATSWRQMPQHVGGYLSDGGVHQATILSGALGQVKSINARNKQMRDLSGTDDILYSVLEMHSGVIGMLTYGGAFGNTEKRHLFPIRGDNGSVGLELGHDAPAKVTLRIGGATAAADKYTEEFIIDNENDSPVKVLEILGKALTAGDKSKIIATPEVAFHHLAVIDAAIESSSRGGQTVEVKSLI
ncbi:DEKNAAC103177 [Brettanomyces naardenensis]|uniref:DEKNAAC103179 n=1 Tax=Brettanomyces naardenensis TaxID=13370 RepID=A0A448YMS9_BRENA|nr:DEKNAAC103177 [Brettanomyces naardenensis]